MKSDRGAEMRETWQRIDSWLKKNAPEIFNDLLPGASVQEIQEFQSEIKNSLTDDMTQSYQIHNGQSGGSSPLMGEWQIMPLMQIIREWKLMQKLLSNGKLSGDANSDGKTRADWWNPGWIPLASNGAGDFKCLDLDPLPKGNVGQVISFWHTLGDRNVIFPSFRDWITTFANDLEHNRYSFKEGVLLFNKKDD